MVEDWKLEVQSRRHFVADSLPIDVKFKSLGEGGGCVLPS